MIQNLVAWFEGILGFVAAILGLGYFALITYVLIARYVEKKVKADAVTLRRLTDSDGKVYCVIPWPEADEAGWVQHMKWVDKNPLRGDFFIYLDEWEAYKRDHPEILEEA